LAFALSYNKVIVPEDHCSEPPLLKEYKKRIEKTKKYEKFEVPIEYLPDVADDNPTQPLITSITIKRKAAARATSKKEKRKKE